MAAQRGSQMTIKIGDGNAPEAFSTLGGLRVTRLRLENGMQQASSMESGEWRVLLPASSLRSMTLEGDGMFTDAASEERARALAFSGAVNNYRLYFGNGDHLAGTFLIAAYEREGEHTEEEQYTIRLESAGAVSYVAG